MGEDIDVLTQGQWGRILMCTHEVNAGGSGGEY